MNLQTPNHLHPIIFKPTPQFFQNPLFNQSHQVTNSHPFLHPLMLHKSPQPTLHFIQTDHPILRIFPKSPKKLIILSPYNNNYYTLTSSTIESSNSKPPTPTPSSAYSASLAQSSTSTESSKSTNRAYRTFRRKFPNHPFPTKPGTAREYINHPHHTNTKDFLAITLPSFPQYTLNTTNDTRSFVDEHVLMPTLYWTSYYHFTNPLCLPLSNTHIDIERNQDMLYRLTTSLTHRQFTYIGYKKSLKLFTAPRANEFTLEYYDHNIIRTNQDQF